MHDEAVEKLNKLQSFVKPNVGTDRETKQDLMISVRCCFEITNFHSALFDKMGFLME